MALPSGAAQVFADRTRFSVLDQFGNVAEGAATFSTTVLTKATFAPTLETGDTIAVKGADGTLKVLYKHGDMPKFFTMQLELASVPPVLEVMLNGGNVLATTGAALATPGTITATESATGGYLANGTYSYKVVASNQWGTTVASAAASATVAASATSVGSVALSVTAVSGATYYRWYGRKATAWQFIAQTRTPTYTDVGLITPTGKPPTVNTSAGPGSAGMQGPPLGVVGNAHGVSIEFWGKAIVNGIQTPDLPYYWWAIPWCRNLHTSTRTFTDATLENIFMGECFQNTNWGAGPFGDYPTSATTRVYQAEQVSINTLPAPGLSPVPAAA